MGPELSLTIFLKRNSAMAELDKLEQKAKADFEKLGKELDKEASEDKAALRVLSQGETTHAPASVK